MLEKLALSLIILWIPLATAAPAFAATPAEPPCDVLVDATPGLFGLCVAFCEAQSCAANADSAARSSSCETSEARLLETYEAQRKPGDPEMPCLQSACPCWSAGELQSIQATFPEFCFDADILGLWSEVSILECATDACVLARLASVTQSSTGNTCTFQDYFVVPPVERASDITDEEAETCATQLRAHGAAMGFTCFP